jgi:hypothetical protein
VKTRIKVYNTLALPAVLYSSENWTIKARDTRRVTEAEMKCMRKAGECTWIDYTTNTEIAEELNITPILDKIREYRRNCLLHIKRNAL